MVCKKVREDIIMPETVNTQPSTSLPPSGYGTPSGLPPGSSEFGNSLSEPINQSNVFGDNNYGFPSSHDEVTVKLNADLAGKNYTGTTLKAGVDYTDNPDSNAVDMGASINVTIPLGPKTDKTEEIKNMTLPVINDTKEKLPLAVSPGNKGGYELSELPDDKAFNVSSNLADYALVEDKMNGAPINNLTSQKVIVHLLDSKNDDDEQADAVMLAPSVEPDRQLNFKSFKK
jgi:hypothetical protein